MKKTMLIAALFVGAMAFSLPAFAGMGSSSIEGSISGSASNFGHFSVSGFNGGFGGDAGSLSPRGVTGTETSGNISGNSFGNFSQTFGYADGFGNAGVGPGWANANSGSDTGASATNGVASAESYGGAFANHGGGGGWWSIMP